MFGRQAIVEIFRREGVEYIFGNPGTTEMPLIVALEDHPPIKYILSLHEGAALGMAHMYANASGKTGVVNLHVAPGLGNALGALYNAMVGKMPLLVTAGQQDSRMLIREPLLSHDLVAMARPLTKWSVQIQHIEEIPVIIPRAFKVAQDPPRGPVFVALPSDILDDEADLDLPSSSSFYRRTPPDPQGIEAAAEILIGAKNPVIICGDGVAASKAQAELVQVAERLGAPVWNTMMMGSLNFPTSHPHFTGVLPAEFAVIRSLLGEADTVLAVGANLFEEVFYSKGSPLPEDCSLIHMDDSTREIGKNLPVAVGLPADLKVALQKLLESLVSKMTDTYHQEAQKRCAAIAEQKKQNQDRQEQRVREKWDNQPISPARLMADLRDCLPPDAIIYNEAITASIDLFGMIPFDQPGSFFGNHGGGIGQGLPGALGVKLAKPDQTVIAVVGDGSAMYTIQSFYTAAYHNIPVIYIIISNQSYRILKYNMNRYLLMQRITKERPYPFMNLNEPALDFVSLARGMGMSGKCITRPDDIQPTIKEALSLGEPYVIEIRTEGKGPGE